MGLLGVLGFGFELPRLVRQVFFAVAFTDQGAQFVQRLPAHGYRVRSHVSDQADGTFVQVDAFIQTLGHHHGLLGAEAQLAGSLLLQR